MTTVRTILEGKGGDVWSVTPETPVIDALKLMAEKNLGALVVLKDERLAGIFSERDYARRSVLRGGKPLEAPVRDLMTRDVITVKLNQSIEDCMTLMTARRIRHLPVMENERIVGIVSIGDVVKALISEKDYLIKQLENYITGAR